MAQRTSCNFGIEPPAFTPADRLQALHEVAEKAREVIDALPPTAVGLALALGRLDHIERYLGMPGREP